MRDHVLYLALDHVNVIQEELEEVVGERMFFMGILTKGGAEP